MRIKNGLGMAILRGRRDHDRREARHQPGVGGEVLRWSW